MKKGDRVYAAGFNYDGDVEISALTVKAVGKEITVAERCAPLKYAARVPWQSLAMSRREALVHLVARAEVKERAAVAALEEARQRLAKARECLAKAEEGSTS